MIRFLAKRILWMVLTLWIVFTISFILMRQVPGGPLHQERAVEPHIQANLERRYQLDKPLIEQYWLSLSRTARLDFGPCFKMGDFTVNDVIAQGLPVSASLGILALSFALVLGTLAGVISAVRRQSWLDFSLMALATVGIALPSFVIAGFAIILCVFLLHLLPAAGWGSLEHVVLPAFCLGAPYAAYIARLVRTGMLDVLGQDYIRTARAKGLPPRTVIVKHAMRGALLPLVSYLGPAVAGILTGSLVVEQIFRIPGLGIHFVRAAEQRDYTLAMGLVVLYTALLYTMNLLVDMAYSWFDPRVKLE